MLRLTEKVKRISRVSSLPGIGVTIISLLFLAGLIGYRAHPAFAAGREASLIAQPSPALPAIPQTDGQFFNDDLTIGEGELYPGDVVVYTGNVTMQSGGAISGNLVLSSGDLRLKAGSDVRGDVVAFSGDVRIDGHIGGDLVVWSGDITLGETAVVGGDVSLMNGKIKRASGATVGGNIVTGPKLPDISPLLNQLKLPTAPNAIDGIAPVAPPAPTGNQGGVGAYLVRLLWRLLGAAVLTGLVVLASGLAYYARPTFVQAVRTTLHQQRPLSFGVGLAVNIVLTLLLGLAFGTGSLLITICLSPLGLMAGLIFFAVNVGGWAALALEIGERLLARVQRDVRSPLQLLAGALVITAPLTIAWAFGSCFQPVGYLAMLILTALGGGAVLVYQLKLGRGGTGLASSNAA